jgi:hypothetical protein
MRSGLFDTGELVEGEVNKEGWSCSSSAILVEPCIP